MTFVSFVIDVILQTRYDILLGKNLASPESPGNNLMSETVQSNQGRVEVWQGVIFSILQHVESKIPLKKEMWALEV